MSRLKRALGLAAILLLSQAAACQPRPAVTPAAQQTPTILAVQVSFTLQPLEDQFQACANELENTALVVRERPSASFDLDQAALALRWGLQTAPEGYAAEIGQEELMWITHPDNPTSTLPVETLRAFYRGEEELWPAEGSGPPTPVQPWGYAKSEDIQQVFDQVLLNGVPQAQQAAFLAPDPAAMIEAVAANPGAVGYLPERWLNEKQPGDVKPLVVEGIESSQLRQPILALSKSEPKGQERAWLLCLQERLTE